MKVAALLITCNRREMLRKLIEDFMGQTRKPDDILVVDNGSEDDTVEFVKKNFPSVRLVELKQNTGHMGGLEVGIKTAIQGGYDAIFSVDDDARLSKDTFEGLMNAVESNEELRDGVTWSANVSPDGTFFTEPVSIKVGDEWKVYYEFLPELHGKVYETIGGANIGLFLPLSVIERVGLPWGHLTFNGEPEYNYRLQTKGVKMYRCFASVIYHRRFEFYEVKMLGRTRYVCDSVPWRMYYEIRNIMYVDRVYKRRNALRSLFNAMIIASVKIRHCDNKIAGVLYVLRAAYDGLLGKTGMRIKIPRPRITNVNDA